MSSKKKEYNIEESPFYSKNIKLRASLEELSASEGEDIVLAHKRYFKNDEYIKFIVTDELDILSHHNLPSLAKTILYYILYNCLEYNTPTFRFKASVFAKILNTDTSTVHKGLRTLINIGYIAKTNTREVYWINHNKYYKGNYIIDKYLKKKK